MANILGFGCEENEIIIIVLIVDERKKTLSTKIKVFDTRNEKKGMSELFSL